MPYPLLLSGLSTREQIVDAVHRACLGLDSNNQVLWESAWTADPDVSLEFGDHKLVGLEMMNKYCFNHIGPMTTQHLLTSVRVDVAEGASVAYITTNALNQHFPAGQGLEPHAEHMLAGSLYDIQAIKEASGEWKIKKWVATVLWRQGNPAIMRPA